MARVLIVEDEPVLRSSMARGIAKIAGVNVAEAGTVQAALEAIDAGLPQMIISDIDLPDRSGLELLGELGRRHVRVPVLFVSAYLKAYASQIPPHADVDVREKPVELDELRAIVQARLAAAPDEAEEAPFGPTDYLQLACLGHRSVVIEVEGGESKGTIVVHAGTLWTARDERGVGQEAFRRLCFLAGAGVRVRALREDPGVRTIFDNWEHLLLEAARMFDEEAHSQTGGALDALVIEASAEPPVSRTRAAREEPRPPQPTLPSAMEIGEEAPSEFDALFDRGVTALLTKDYGAAFTAFTQAAAQRPEDAKTQANLARLRQLGHGGEGT